MKKFVVVFVLIGIWLSNYSGESKKMTCKEVYRDASIGQACENWGCQIDGAVKQFTCTPRPITLDLTNCSIPTTVSYKNGALSCT